MKMDWEEFWINICGVLCGIIFFMIAILGLLGIHSALNPGDSSISPWFAFIWPVGIVVGSAIAATHDKDDDEEAEEVKDD